MADGYQVGDRRYYLGGKDLATSNMIDSTTAGRTDFGDTAKYDNRSKN